MSNNGTFDAETVIREGHRLDHLIATGDEESKAQAWRDKLALLAELDRESERLASLRARVAENPGPQLRIQF